ncbi:uncharacterized protein LOC120334057 isoform X5 [Styela clava]
MFEEFDPKPQIMGTMLKFIRKEFDPKPRITRTMLKFIRKANQTQRLTTPIATLSLEHCSWADTDRWGVATYSVISLHPLILRRMQRI